MSDTERNRVKYNLVRGCPANGIVVCRSPARDWTDPGLIDVVSHELADDLVKVGLAQWSEQQKKD